MFCGHLTAPKFDFFNFFYGLYYFYAAKSLKKLNKFTRNGRPRNTEKAITLVASKNVEKKSNPTMLFNPLYSSNPKQ